MSDLVGHLRSIADNSYVDDYPLTTAKRSADLIEKLQAELEVAADLIEQRESDIDVAAIQLHQKDKLIEKLQKQLPEGMQDCTIQTRECKVGHAWLTAKNWLEHDCHMCKLEKYQASDKVHVQYKLETDAELDKYRKALEGVRDFDDEQECLPGCDSIAHEEFCPWVNDADCLKKIAREALSETKDPEQP